MTTTFQGRASFGVRGFGVVHHLSDLRQDLPGLEVPPVAADAGQAERALDRTTPLGGYADSLPASLGNVDAFNGGPVIASEERLDRAVGRKLAIGHGSPPHLILRGQIRSQGGGEIGHAGKAQNAA